VVHILVGLKKKYASWNGLHILLIHLYQSVIDSGVARSLSQGGNVAEEDPLATVGDLLANIRKKLRNYGESWCGWLYYGLLCGLWVWRRRTNRRPCCPPMSNPSTSPWTAWPDGSGRWDNRMVSQHLPRDLVRPSSGLNN